MIKRYWLKSVSHLLLSLTTTSNLFSISLPNKINFLFIYEYIENGTRILSCLYWHFIKQSSKKKKGPSKEKKGRSNFRADQRTGSFFFLARNLERHLWIFSAFGHMLSYFHFSKALAKARVHVSFVSTPTTLGTPDKITGTSSAIFDVKFACDLLKHPFKQFVAEKSSNWIISDFCFHWVFDIAEEYDIRVIHFSILCETLKDFLGPAEYLVGDRLKSI